MTGYDTSAYAAMGTSTMALVGGLIWGIGRAADRIGATGLAEPSAALGTTLGVAGLVGTALVLLATVLADARGGGW